MKKTALIIIILTLYTGFARSSSFDPKDRPKIGLVLSGGAAKGLAHIGVLKVLEEAGIRPDYITGTSMGAIVGGLYASGYSAEEISALAEEVDWDFLLSDRLPLNKIAFEEKYEYNKYIFGIPIRNYKFRLPSGVIAGQQLENCLSELMWPLEEDINFDSLPIPFHCLGVDLLSGQVIEFDSGNLAKSIRASMAIPSIFSPESIDSMLLVDGGISRNFPVKEVQDMGADVIIGVYVGFNDKVSKEDMFSLTNVLSRSTVLQGIVDTKKQLKYLDIYIEPDLEGLGAGDFNKASRLIELGELAALNHKSELMNLADSLNLIREDVKKSVENNKIRVHSIKVINNRDFISDRFVIAKSGLEPGDTVSKSDLSDAIDRIYGTQYFEKVNYSLEKNVDGTYVVLFKVKEFTRAFLKFAIHHNNQYGSSIVTNLTLRNYLIPETRALISLRIAENPGILIDINKYFGEKQRLIKDVFFEWNRYENYLYNEGIDLGRYNLNTLKTGIVGKYSFSQNHQFGICGLYEKQRIFPGASLKNYFKTESFEEYAFQGFAYKLFYNYNSTDSRFLPKKGFKIDIWYKYFYNQSINFDINQEDRLVVDDVFMFRNDRQNFSMFYLNTDKYYTLLNRVTASFGATLGISSDESIGMGNFVIGGYHQDRRQHYLPFAGKNFAEDVISDFVIIKSGLDIKIISDLYFSAKVNWTTFSQSTDYLKDIIENKKIDFHQMGLCAGIQANTRIGPVSLMAGLNDYSKDIKWYISIGCPF